MEELLKKHGMQYQTMIDKIKTMKNPKLMRASKQQIKFLQSRKVLHKKATVAIMISLESASKCCRLLGMPTPVCDRLADPEAGMHVPAVPVQAAQTSAAPGSSTSVAAAAGAIPNSPPGFNYTHPHLQSSIHKALPKVQWDPEDLNRPRFGLETFRHTQPQVDLVHPQLEQYQEYRQELIMMDRPQWVSRLQPGSSWDSHRNAIMRFLGFTHHFVGVEFPVLNHFLNINLVMLYISYQMSRGMQPTNLASITHDARVVSEWWWSTQVSEQEKLLNSARYKQHLEQLENLGKQCSSNLAPDPQKVLARVEQQQQRREQLSAPELMLIMYSLWLSAMSSLPYDSLEAAESVQMVLMLIFFFGFIPPQRESVILSLQLPGSKCMHPNCQHRDKCLGNHIRACVGDSDRLELFVQHYKGDKHKGYVPLQVPLPPEICALYQAHLGSGRDLIIDSTVGLETVEAEAVAPYLFIWPSTLKPISMAQVHKVFNQLVLSDSDLSFGVQWLRTVFVEHMRAVGSAACGLDESAAARMMGHHIGVWNVAYDKFKQHRSSAHVEQVMPVWRGKLLQQQGGSDLLEQGKQALLANGFKD